MHASLSLENIYLCQSHFSSACNGNLQLACNANQITVDRGQMKQQLYCNGQQAQIICNNPNAQLFLTTVNTANRLLNNQHAYDLGTAPTCTNGAWQTETVFKCRGLLLIVEGM